MTSFLTTLTSTGTCRMVTPGRLTNPRSLSNIFGQSTWTQRMWTKRKKEDEDNNTVKDYKIYDVLIYLSLIHI